MLSDQAEYLRHGLICRPATQWFAVAIGGLIAVALERPARRALQRR